jgi:hypothetical protein
MVRSASNPDPRVLIFDFWDEPKRLHAHPSYVCIVVLLVYSFLKLIYVSASNMFENSHYFYMSLACLMFTQNSIKETSLHKVLSCLNIASTPLFRTIREVNNTITI